MLISFPDIVFIICLNPFERQEVGPVEYTNRYTTTYFSFICVNQLELNKNHVSLCLYQQLVTRTNKTLTHYGPLFEFSNSKIVIFSKNIFDKSFTVIDKRFSSYSPVILWQ